MADTPLIPPVQSNQQLVDPKTGFGRPPFILLINNLISQVVNASSTALSAFLKTKPTGGNGIDVTGTYGTGVTISLDADLSDLNDVSDTSPTDGQVLTWVNADGLWEPKDSTGGGGGPVGEAAWKVDATGTGVPQAITIPDNNPTLQSIIVSVNGIRYDTTNYSISGTTVTLSTNSAGDSIEIVGPVGNGTTTPFLVTGTGTGLPQALTLPIGGLTPQTCLVYVNGIRQPISLYSIIGSTLTLTTNASGDSIEIVGPLGVASVGKPWYWSPPQASDFTVVANQQNMTMTDNGDVGLLVNGGTPSVNQQFMGKAAPNSDWSVTTHLNNTLLSSASFSSIGLALVDPALSKITWLATLDARNDVRSENWTFPATFSSEPAETDLSVFTAAGMFIRATYTLATSTVVVEISADGKQWATHMTLNVSTWLGSGPYNVGFTIGYTRSSGIITTGNVDMWLQSW